MKKNLTLTLAGFALLCTATLQPLQAASVIWYRFDDTGSTILNSGTGGSLYDATKPETAAYSTNTAGAYINDGQGNLVANTGSYFNGATAGFSGATLSTSATAGLADIFSRSFTVEALVYLNTSPAFFQQIFGNGGETGGEFLFATQNTGILRLYGRSVTGSTAFQVTSDLLAAEQWYSIAAVGTWDEQKGATTVQLYIDGVATGASHDYLGGMKIDPASQFRIGSPNSFNGYIDELRISNTALATSQFLKAEAIPEPATVWMAVAAGATALVWHRRRREADLQGL